MDNPFIKLAAINVNEHVEKKGNLSYLSWPWAVDQLLRADPTANWHYKEPVTFPDGTMLVFCVVCAFGMERPMQLPVMDHRNKAIANPDAFAINTAMQRCLVKAIALHGLGLYIYAGEDLPSGESAPAPKMDPKELADWCISIDSMATMEDLRKTFTRAVVAAHKIGDAEAEATLRNAKDARKATLDEGKAA